MSVKIAFFMEIILIANYLIFLFSRLYHNSNKLLPYLISKYQLKSNITVSGTKDFIKFYKQLGKTNPLRQQLDNAMDLLKKNPNVGNRIKGDFWPAKYIKKYGINNLYRYSLGSNWRMTYTIIGQSSGINCIILHVLDHKNYDNLFGYKTS